jgi:hypothetical protein
MLNIRLDDSELTRLAERAALLTDRQLRFAVAQAMTDSAKDAQAELKRVTAQFVDRPTPFTVNSTFVRFANPSNLSAQVGFKQFAAKGTPAGEYLSPMVRGGDRKPTRVEEVLRRGGVIRRNQYIMPGRGWNVDPYGNVRRGVYTQMLSQTKAFGGDLSYLNASRSKASIRKRETRGQFFVPRSGELGQGASVILYRAPGADRKDAEVAFVILNDVPNHERRFPIPVILGESYKKAFQDHIRTKMTAELARALGK